MTKLWSCIFIILSGILILIHVIMCVYIVLWLVLFSAHLDAAALSVLVSLWICCRCHLAEAVLDNLQCRCCVFSCINTDTQCLLLSHMAQSTLPWSFLPFTELQWWPITASKVRERKKAPLKDMWETIKAMLEKKWGHTKCSVSLAYASAHWQAAQLLRSPLVHPVFYFWYFFNNLLCGLKLVLFDRHSPVMSRIWMHAVLVLIVSGFKWYSLFLS